MYSFLIFLFLLFSAPSRRASPSPAPFISRGLTIYVCVCVCVYIYHIYVCIYIYLYIYVYIYIYIYTYIYMNIYAPSFYNAPTTFLNLSLQACVCFYSSRSSFLFFSALSRRASRSPAPSTSRRLQFLLDSTRPLSSRTAASPSPVQ